QPDFSANLHQLSNVRKVIGVVSGKGGVGKSLVTSLMAVTMQRRGHKTAILDADISGPSIPKAFGIKERPRSDAAGMHPVKSKTGIEVMSINLLLEEETSPVIWRGPLIANVVKQFWTDVIWRDVDYMFIDLPPGTGDVPLTIYQSFKLDGIIIVTSPQELVSMIVAKAVHMAQTMKVPILGLVENMSYFTCPDCNRKHNVFGSSHIDEIATEHGLRVLGRLPIDPKLAAACDQGLIELFNGNWLDSAALTLEQAGSQLRLAVAGEQGQVAQHFGHCESFHIFDTSEQKITDADTIANPGHKPGFLPRFLADMGVDVIIAGGMGSSAVELFNERGIEVVVGARGLAAEAANLYLQGHLKSTGSVCHEHQHHEECEA
ncbi:MAG TPA: P-loop NTPase, partial [Bacillota bacterium]|nr:P-loop NTPase [Bacillota bacterium]